MPYPESEDTGWVVMDPTMRRIRDLARRVALTDVPLLITGESGTGKDVLARFVHRGSPRSEEPFVALNCAAIPTELVESELFGFEKGAFSGANQAKPGAFELADQGTLFLDEIGEMPLGIQSKLLRAVEHMTFRRLGGRRELRVNTRIVAATNQPIREQIQQRRFREDLYYRLSVSEIHLPPLRERPADVPLLCAFFMRQLNDKYRVRSRLLSDEALDALRRHAWPGNIRQLRNVLERACLMSDTDILTLDHLPAEISHRNAARGGDAHTRRDGGRWAHYPSNGHPDPTGATDSDTIGWHRNGHDGGGQLASDRRSNGWNGDGWSANGWHGGGSAPSSRGSKTPRDGAGAAAQGTPQDGSHGREAPWGGGGGMEEGESVTIPVGTSLRRAELMLIRTTLRSVDNNKTHAARILGCSRKTLHNKLNARSREE